MLVNVLLQRAFCRALRGPSLRQRLSQLVQVASLFFVGRIVFPFGSVSLGDSLSDGLRKRNTFGAGILGHVASLAQAFRTVAAYLKGRGCILALAGGGTPSTAEGTGRPQRDPYGATSSTGYRAAETAPARIRP